MRRGEGRERQRERERERERNQVFECRTGTLLHRYAACRAAGVEERRCQASVYPQVRVLIYAAADFVRRGKQISQGVCVCVCPQESGRKWKGWIRWVKDIVAGRV